MTKIILEILLKGEIQVSGKERENQTESLLKEIATIVADKCVNPQTKLPYPAAVIEKAIQDIHFSPNLTKNAKQQVHFPLFTTTMLISFRLLTSSKPSKGTNDSQ